MKPAFVIAITYVWGVRNFIRSGALQQMSTRYEVFVATREAGRQLLLQEGLSEANILLLPEGKTGQRYNRVLRVAKAAHRKRHPTASDSIFDKWLATPKSSRLKLSDQFYEYLGRAAQPDAIFRRLERTLTQEILNRVPTTLWDFLKRTQPVGGLSTAYVDSSEWPLFYALRKLGIPTATHILSFDNLTSRGYLPLNPFDRYLVWQQGMADELKELYAVSASQIQITGTPQFDFHIQDRFRWSQEQTAQALGIDPGRNYVLYCGNHKQHTPNEPAMVAEFVQQLRPGDGDDTYQWVIRPHPLDDYSRWSALVAQYEDVHISYPWQQAAQENTWALPTDDELALLSNTLRFASATLNVASTIALDSAVVDTPPICIGFHPNAGERESQFYYEVHSTEHYIPIMKSAAVPLVKNMDELRDILDQAVSQPDKLRAARERLVADLCGTVDGKAASRILDELFAMTEGRT